jgi:hypothetical protein
MIQIVSRRNAPAQTSFVPGQKLAAADLNDFATQSIVVGTPTNGMMGDGSINATAIYVNGVAVGSGGGSIWDGGATVWD